MKMGILALVLGYVLSQFYRAFLSVLAPALALDPGVTEGELATASSFFFLAFAAMQIAVGLGLDRYGPRLTVSLLLGIGGAGGAFWFALAGSATDIYIAMLLIGTGCAPVLMGSMYIFARNFPAAVFGSLSGLLIGVGSLGNLGAALPLSLAVEALGWRQAMSILGVVTALAALGVLCFVRDPAKAEVPAGGGSWGAIFRQPALWGVLIIIAVGYAPAATLRGIWGGPYFTKVYEADAAATGTYMLIMGVAMTLGSLLYGPLERLVKSRKKVILGGNLMGFLALALLWWNPQPGLGMAVALIALSGFFGTAFALIMAHGRAFFPPHMVGRGVAILNLCSIGSTGLVQLATRPIYETALASGGVVAGFHAIFGFLALILGFGCLAYALLSPDRTD
ncbi:MFS transporter [Falsigemmobacter faecalis]|uniref:MFS transporter n=1 Tax=Falsigemmobacter faecalis TaxID=2488730 RepID=A0A3P3DHU1_9RHOB|nr:MFS transporter [Falsigemmobacter faecalis]RRH73827.1 MFS transporter [Falsigemmobacter faecalis]